MTAKEIRTLTEYDQLINAINRILELLSPGLATDSIWDLKYMSWLLATKRQALIDSPQYVVGVTPIGPLQSE